MGTLLFEQRTRTAGANEGVGCLGGGALVCLVVVAVNAVLLVTRASMTPSLQAGVLYSTPVLLVLGVGFGAATYWFSKRSARQLELTRRGDALLLRVEPDFAIEGPFVLLYGWYRVPGGRGMKLLWCDVHDGDVPLVRLSQSLGNGPASWPNGMPPMDRPSQHGGFTVARLEELVAILCREGAIAPAVG